VRGSRPALGVVSLFWLPLTSAPLAAQFEARLDVASSNRYVWHGLSRAAGIVVQSSVAAGFRVDRFMITTGVVRHHELDHVTPGELSELGNATGRVGEDDVWAQGAFDLGRLRLRSGVVRHVFRGEAPEGGGGPLRNTAEIYAAAGATSAYLNPTLEAWWDVGRVRGGFLRASASSPVIGWPLEPFFFISLAGEIGVNLGQAPDPARPGDLANFAGRGVTHTGLGVNVVSRLQHWGGVGSASLDLGLNGQLNLDEATRYNGIGRRSNLILWFSAGVALLLGGEAKTPR
jgi:hypothetical protein